MGKHEIRLNEPCLIWQGNVGRSGYPIHIGHGRSRLRVLFEKAYGPIEGLHLDHECHNADAACAGGKACIHRRCMNLNHVRPVPPGVNALSGKSFAARYARRNHCARGHLLEGANLKARSDGGRRCRICERTYSRDYKARMKEKASIG